MPGGGVVNIVTKSGSNALHGSAFEYLAQREIERPKLLCQSQRWPETKSIRLLSRRTDSDRIKRSCSVPGKGRKSGRIRPHRRRLCLPRRRGEATFRACRPLTDPRTGQPYPGNIIPSAQFDSVALKVLELVPVAPPMTALFFSASDDNFG